MIAGLYTVPDKSIAPGNKNSEPVSYNTIFHLDLAQYRGDKLGKILKITGYASRYGYETKQYVRKFLRIITTCSLFIITA